MTLTMALLHLGVPVSLDRQHQGPGTAPLNWTACINVLSSTCAFPAMTCQNVCCKKKDLLLWRVQCCQNSEKQWKLDPSCNKPQLSFKTGLDLTCIISPEKHQLMWHFLLWVYDQFHQPALKRQTCLEWNKIIQEDFRRLLMSQHPQRGT